MAERDTRTGCPACERLKARVAELEAQLAAARNTRAIPPSRLPVILSSFQESSGGRGQAEDRRPAGPSAARTASLPTRADRRASRLHPRAVSRLRRQAARRRARPKVIQQVEILVNPLHIAEHRGQAYWCPKCQQVHYAPLPAEVVKAGLAGPRLTALVGFLKGACHASFSTIRKFLRDVAGVKVSRGQLAKLVQKVSASLEQPYDELLAALPKEARLHVDETGHPDRGTGCGPGASALLCTRCTASVRPVARTCWLKCWARNSMACWAATTSAPTAST